METVQSVFIQLQKKPARKVIVKRGVRAEDYAQAILAVEQAMDRYDPALIGYRWNDAEPRIQLEPKGERGYIELRAVRHL